MKPLTLLVALLFIAQASLATVISGNTLQQTDPRPQGIATWWQKQISKFKGVKTWHTQQRAAQGEPTEKQVRKGRLSMILGIASFVAIFIPFVNLLALPAGILAIVFGAQSVKGNGNAKGIVGIVLGSITTLIFLLAVLFLAVLLFAL